MTVYENVAYPLREHTTYDEPEIERRVREKLAFVDLDPDVVMDQLPSALSGGMRKRVGSRARSRTIRRSCSTTSRPRDSIRSRPGRSRASS
jgi:ABC-type transporter Mla maintaining outer membrane lipid asymmetry ATPase subunit MlaF